MAWWWFWISIVDHMHSYDGQTMCNSYLVVVFLCNTTYPYRRLVYISYPRRTHRNMYGRRHCIVQSSTYLYPCGPLHHHQIEFSGVCLSIWSGSRFGKVPMADLSVCHGTRQVTICNLFLVYPFPSPILSLTHFPLHYTTLHYLLPAD